MLSAHLGRLVISTYDLTFLQNFFDGVDLYKFDFEGVVTKRGGISSMILNKITVSDAITESYNSFKTWYCAHTSTITRCLKYQERGFHIDDGSDDDMNNFSGILTTN